MKKHSSSAAASLTGADIDDHIANIRVPALHKERDAVSKQLADIFSQIGHLSDPDWEVNADVLEVNSLLTGGAVDLPPASMPKAALHHHLKVRLRNIDTALHQAQAFVQRSADRREAEVLGRFQDEINAIEKTRVLLANQLQAVNRRREALRDKLLAAGGGSYLPTDGAPLLDVGYGDDEVVWVNARVLHLGILTTGEIKNAAK